MSENPYPPGTTCHREYEMGLKIAVDEERLDEYAAWSRGILARLGIPTGQAALDDRFLAGFDAGLEAAQEHDVAGDGRDWKEIATHLLAQVIGRRIAAGWQPHPEDAARNAIEYHRLEIRDHLDLAREHIDRIRLTRETP